MGVLKKILYLLPEGDHIKLGFLFLLMIFATILEVIGVGMIPAFISIIATPDTVLSLEILKPVYEYLNISNAGDLLLFGSSVLIITYLFKNTYIIAFKYIQKRYLMSRYVYVGSSLYEKYIKAPYEFHLERNTAELLRNIMQESHLLIMSVMTPLLKLAMETILIIGIFTMLLWVEPLITIIVFVIVGGSGALFLKSIKAKTTTYGKQAQKDRSSLIKTVNEGLGGVKDVKVLRRENWFYDRFLNHIKSYSRSQTYRDVAAASGKPIIETIAVGSMLLIAVILYLQGRGIEMILPILTLFGTATIRLLPSIQHTASSITTIRYYINSIHAVYDDTFYLQKHVDKKMKQGGAKNIPDLSKEIIFENVSYRYPNSDEHAVNNINLKIHKGEAIGFVGSSGAGKTTLVDLLLGLIEPQYGTIKIDGVDIRHNIHDWLKQVGYIPQFIFLADDTIKNNIALGLPDHQIIEKQLFEAIEAAQLSDLIESLPKGVDTIIGENGTRLSGGQRQRIGIARALYHNPSVLIMDEATAALDNVTEKYVIDAIENLKGSKTIISIAHRLSTVKNCDKLYLLKEGSIINKGTFQELVRVSEDFQKMQNEILNI